MGAQPAWTLLALTLPEADPSWLSEFAQGFGALAQAHGVELIGGDMTRGPLTVTVQALGLVPVGQALRRDGAKVGDWVYVSGSLGDAGLALLLLQNELRGLSQRERQQVLDRLYRPMPRIALGLALRGIASAAIDISDGLAADLGHILHASQVGATLQASQLPLSATLTKHLHAVGGWSLPLSAGDDYELCFTVPPARQAELTACCAAAGQSVTWIGVIERQLGLRCLEANGNDITPSQRGYQHF
jgi:thiamine-monophosphate kinase